MADLAATFRKPFPHQVAAWRLRMGNRVSTEVWTDLWQSAHDRAFMVAGATKAAMLADLAEAVDKAIAEGTSLEEFRRDFRAIVEKHGWHGWTGEGTKGGEAWRTKVIYRTNARTSYAAGRYAQLVDGNFRFWVYRHGGSLHPREVHLHDFDGLVLPPEHPFWATHYPPNGWGCSCYAVGARSLDAALRLGGNPEKQLPANWQELDAKTGAPLGVDKGWAYAPGASVAETVSIAAPMFSRLPAILGADFGEAMAPLIAKTWPIWVADTLAENTQHQPGLAGTLTREIIEALEKRGLKPVSAEITVRPGLVAGPKHRRHYQRGDYLLRDEWAVLPWALRNPVAVLYDTNTDRLLYILPGDHGHSQLAVAVNYSQSVNRQTRIQNSINSAYHPNLEALRGRLATGRVVLLTGDIE